MVGGKSIFPQFFLNVSSLLLQFLYKSPSLHFTTNTTLCEVDNIYSLYIHCKNFKVTMLIIGFLYNVKNLR